MKKIILILLVLVIGITSAYSSILQIGPTTTLNDVNVFDEDFIEDLEELDYLDPSIYKFGLDARINLLFLSAQANAFYQPPTDTSGHIMDTTVYGILDFSLFSIIRLGVGPGLNYALDFTNLPKTFDDVLQNGSFNLKAHLSVDFGGTALSAYYVLPTAYKWNGPLPINGLFDFEKGSLGISLLFGI